MPKEREKKTRERPKTATLNDKILKFMIKRLELTEDHLKLIPFFFLEEEGDDRIVFDRRIMFNLGSHLLEDMAMILGLEDQAIPGTENDPDGRAYKDEAENYMLGLHDYLKDNLYEIETLIHQYVTRGGLKPGTYKCKDNELIWERDGEEKE